MSKQKQSADAFERGCKRALAGMAADFRPKLDGFECNISGGHVVGTVIARKDKAKQEFSGRKKYEEFSGEGIARALEELGLSLGQQARKWYVSGGRD